MAGNVAEFNGALREFSFKVVPEAAGAVLRATALQGLAGVIDKTPVDTGRARGGWQVGIGETPDAPTEALDTGGDATQARGNGVIAGAGPFELITISNNVEYIEVLEDGRGVRDGQMRGSEQAPFGMLGLTFEELIQALEVVEEVE